MLVPICRSLFAAAVAALALAAPAGAATSSLSATVTTEQPPAAGTQQAARLVLGLAVSSGGQPQRQQSIVFDLPAGLVLDGTGFATCSPDAINAAGAGACDPASRVGSGSGLMVLGPQQSQLPIGVTAFNGGPGSVTLYLQTSMFSIAVPAALAASPDPGFGRRLAIDVPERISQPVAGLTAEIRSLALKFSARRPGGVTFASVGACPSTPARSTVTWAAGDYAIPTVAHAAATCSLGVLPPESPLASPPGPNAIAIDGGARYTRDPDVVINPVWSTTGADAIQLSHDPAFASASLRPIALSVPWTLAAGGGTRTVHARFVRDGDVLPEVYTDAIVLDPARPAIRAAAIAGGKLRVKAADRFSGVAKMQVGPRKSARLKRVRFRPVSPAPRGKRVFVRVIDRAGNASGWRRAKAAR